MSTADGRITEHGLSVTAAPGQRYSKGSHTYYFTDENSVQMVAWKCGQSLILHITVGSHGLHLMLTNLVGTKVTYTVNM